MKEVFSCDTFYSWNGRSGDVPSFISQETMNFADFVNIQEARNIVLKLKQMGPSNGFIYCLSDCVWQSKIRSL